mgnify:CR=1 FL=1
MLQNTSNKATVSYGYGLQATFMQILNAFAIYNNDGVMITPRVVKQLQKDGKIYNLNEPAIKVNAIDPTAAGDTFLGGLATFLSKGKSIEESIKFATKAASICVQRFGAIESIPFKEDVI